MTEGKTHSVFGGSFASRWMNCAGSVALCETMPARPSSAYAAEGTMAHALAEYCLKHGQRNAMENLGGNEDGDLRKPVFTEEMCKAVNVYLDAVYAEMDANPDAELYVERSFVLSEAHQVFGTNDALIYIPSQKRMVVFDYKHGAGVSVFPDDNSQLKFYGVGALLNNPWPVEAVKLVIVQPRARDAYEYGMIRPWTTDAAELIDFLGDVNQAVSAARSPDAALSPGGWCRWCDAAAVCPAREQEFLQAANLQFASITDITAPDLPEVATLDTYRLSAILKAAETLEGWISQVRERVEVALLQEGLAVPGWKVVEKIARAKWVEDDAIIAAHLNVAYGIPEDETRPRKLVTITEAERLVKEAVSGKDERKAAIDAMRLHFTTKESSGYTIAPDSDRREAVVPVAVDFQVNDLMAQ